jgi:hypothetical protein
MLQIEFKKFCIKGIRFPQKRFKDQGEEAAPFETASLYAWNSQNLFAESVGHPSHTNTMQNYEIMMISRDFLTNV